MPVLKINVSDELYNSLKKHHLLKDAINLATDGLINGIILKMNKEMYRRKGG